jgi:hypothetical protein
MSDPNTHRSEADAELEREIRKERKFSLSEAIGRLAGPGAMKGASPVARQRQVELQICDYLKLHLCDPSGALAVVLSRRVEGSDLLLNNLDRPPLVVLAGCVQRTLDSPVLLNALVREADVEWGRIYGERPYFDRPGSVPHPDDPYTAESVRGVLRQLFDALAADSRSA